MKPVTLTTTLLSIALIACAESPPTNDPIDPGGKADRPGSDVGLTITLQQPTDITTYVTSTDGPFPLTGRESVCLDTVGKSTGNGAALVMAPCDGGSSQAWQITSSGQIYNPFSNKCVSVPYDQFLAAAQHETPITGAIVAWDCWGDHSQSFVKSPGHGDGRFHLGSPPSGALYWMCLDMVGGVLHADVCVDTQASQVFAHGQPGYFVDRTTVSDSACDFEDGKDGVHHSVSGSVLVLVKGYGHPRQIQQLEIASGPAPVEPNHYYQSGSFPMNVDGTGAFSFTGQVGLWYLPTVHGSLTATQIAMQYNAWNTSAYGTGPLIDPNVSPGYTLLKCHMTGPLP
jgi:hypothetical protein